MNLIANRKIGRDVLLLGSIHIAVNLYRLIYRYYMTYLIGNTLSTISFLI